MKFRVAITPCSQGIWSLFFLTFFIHASNAARAIAQQSPPDPTSLANLGISTTQPTDGPFVEVDGKYLVPYQLVVPGSEVTIDMIPIPGGVFEMGSEEEDDESPQVRIQVDPIWVAKTETSWREYRLYMSMYKLFNSLSRDGKRTVGADEDGVDAVTAPTELYDPSFTYKRGQEPNLPAVTMTQYAAKQYTKWLSKLTACQYRLPTEAEWEYACRAGSTTAFSFGEDPAELGEYAWYADNSDERPQAVGTLKPNAFGLHDMHGNVMEWVIDAYTEDGYASLAELQQPIPWIDAVRWPENVEGRGLRGGSWQDFAEDCRSARRFGSGEETDWKAEDPNLPLSPWWFTNDPTRGVGFRIVRSYKLLDEDTIQKFWEIDHQYLEEDVTSRLQEGRGIRSNVDPSLADDIRESSSGR